MKTTRTQNILTSALAGALAFSMSSVAFAETADTVYTGGNIITVNDAAPSAEALAVKDGKILAVGAKADVLKTKGARDEVGGARRARRCCRALLTGTAISSARSPPPTQANVYPAPFGPGSSIEGIIGALKKHSSKDQHIKPGETRPSLWL